MGIEKVNQQSEIKNIQTQKIPQPKFEQTKDDLILKLDSAKKAARENVTLNELIDATRENEKTPSFKDLGLRYTQSIETLNEFETTTLEISRKYDNLGKGEIPNPKKKLTDEKKEAIKQQYKEYQNVANREYIAELISESDELQNAINKEHYLKDQKAISFDEDQDFPAK